MRRPGRGESNRAVASEPRAVSVRSAVAGINVTPRPPSTHCTAVASDAARVGPISGRTPARRQTSSACSRRQCPSSNNNSGRSASAAGLTSRAPASGWPAGRARTKSSSYIGISVIPGTSDGNAIIAASIELWRRASSNGPVRSSTTLTVRAGTCSLSPRNTDGKTYGATVGIRPSRRVPVIGWVTPAAAWVNESTASMANMALGSRAFPSFVKKTRRVDLSTSLTPSPASRAASAWESDG